MPVATTAWFDLVTGLLAKFRANTTIVATHNTKVEDGPVLTDASRLNILFVGAQPSAVGDEGPDGSFTQEWGALGARTRTEELTVACELVVRSGGTDPAVHRSTAQAILAAVESDLRTDIALSIGRLQWCHITSATFDQQQTTQGFVIIVRFTITGHARLQSQ